jgi:hypothetical protein
MSKWHSYVVTSHIDGALRPVQPLHLVDRVQLLGDVRRQHPKNRLDGVDGGLQAYERKKILILCINSCGDCYSV